MLSFVFASAFCCFIAEGVAFDNYSGFLKDIQKTPPEIRLATGDGEKVFLWITEKTLFLDEDEKELTPLKFLNRFKNKGVTLLFEDGKVTEIFPGEF